jgi:hypothetical protein
VGEQQRPHFLFVCDHGVRGGQLDRAALLPWFPDRAGWWAAEGVDEAAIGMWPLEGDKRGWGIERIMNPPEPGDDPRRLAIEICCMEKRCSRPAYRSDDDKLQNLLMLIVTDERFRTAFTVRADETLVEMTLDALHHARETAKKQGITRV